MQVYDNQLFTDADGSGALGTDQLPGSPTIRAGRPASAQRMQQAKSSLAARRAERMQANILQSNSTGIGSPMKSPMPPGMPPPALQRPDTLRPRGSADEPTSRSTASSASNVYGLKATYDPDEEQQISAVPRAPQQQSGLDLSNMPAFLMQPGPRDGQPIMCRIIREKLGTGKLSSAKVCPCATATCLPAVTACSKKKWTMLSAACGMSWHCQAHHSIDAARCCMLLHWLPNPGYNAWHCSPVLQLCTQFMCSNTSLHCMLFITLCSIP